jgi:hypothetical protein
MMLIFGVDSRPKREFMDGRKNEPMDSANRTNLISHVKYLKIQKWILPAVVKRY